MSHFLHPQGICESSNVGDGTRIGAFAHVLPGASIGRDGYVGDHVFIDDDVSIGDRVTIEGGVQLLAGLRLEDDVFIGANATFPSDRSGSGKLTLVARGASVGASATILPGVTIGQAARVEAGSVVTRSVPPKATVAGNPAGIVGYIETTRSSAFQREVAKDSTTERLSTATQVAGVSFYRLKLVHDLRGDLTIGRFQEEIPFQPKRYFIVFDVPSKDIRGEHAHRTCHQFLVCVKGSVSVIIDDGHHREEVLLDAPNHGLYVPAMTWSTQYNHSPDAVLLAFASEDYDSADYVRDYDQFMALVRARTSKELT